MNAKALAQRLTEPARGRTSTPATRPASRPPSHVTPAIRPTAPGRRRRNTTQILLAMAGIVGLPTILAAIYFGLIASPLYVSESSVTIRSSKIQPASLVEALVAPQEGIVGATETQLVADYLRSRDVLARIDANIGFRERFATYDADYLSRLEPHASNEEMYDYFKKALRVTDDGAGLLTISVRAFTAEDAVAVAVAAISAAEDMVNRLSEAAQTDAMRAARTEVQAAEARMIAAADAVTEYQKQSGDLDPRRSAEAIQSVIGGLEAELAASRVRLAELQSYLKPGSPQVNALNSKIAALKRQIGEERRRLADASRDTLADDVRGFETERMQLELAQQAYRSALASLEAARLAAQNDRSYLVAYAPPSLPDVAVEPKRMYKILSAFVISLLAFGVGALMIGAIREHARA